MRDVAVHAIFRGQRVGIDGDSPTTPSVIPAEHLTFEISAQDELPLSILLDKRPLTLALTPDRKRGHFQLDAFRSVGFHCIDIGDARFYFATDDAKLKLDGILNLLHYVGEAGLSWGQLGRVPPVTSSVLVAEIA
jgi:hypothetical protein